MCSAEMPHPARQPVVVVRAQWFTVDLGTGCFIARNSRSCARLVIQQYVCLYLGLE